MRYEPFIRLLDERTASTVLDVGSGWYGLSWYWPNHVVQTDLKFAAQRPDDTARAGTAQFVCSTAERLPFPDKSFDYVLSSDMMEHLPDAIRGPSIVELTRVARRGVLVGFPTGPAARIDRLIARLLEIKGNELPDWLEEHLAQTAYPDRQTVLDGLPDTWRITDERRNGNMFLSAVVALSEMWGPTAPWAARYERRARRRGMPKAANLGPVVRTVYLLEPAA